MAEQDTTTAEKPSSLEMSDEDFLNQEMPDFSSLSSGQDGDQDQDQKDEGNDDQGTAASAGDDDQKDDEVDSKDGGDDDEQSDDGDAQDDGQSDDGDNTKETDDESGDEGDGDKDEGSENDDKEGDTKESEKKDDSEIDFEAEYRRLMAPFKANGREIQVKNVDDAIALMQMGANYNKKMAALKPNLKLMKMLENNELLNEEKISFLIDVSRKDPNAISKLVTDSGLDPMDLDSEKAGAYKQSTYTVDDREIDFDTVLDEISGTPEYHRTVEIVGNKWDRASKQVVAEQPQLLKVINDHIASGIYDLISNEIDRERMLGRLTGVSDIEAYRQVGDAMAARGEFNRLNKQGGNDSKNDEPVIRKPKPKSEDDDTRKGKRRAASPTRSTTPKSTPQDFNPLAMSDEDFEKVADKRFT